MLRSNIIGDLVDPLLLVSPRLGESHVPLILLKKW